MKVICSGFDGLAVDRAVRSVDKRKWNERDQNHRNDDWKGSRRLFCRHGIVGGAGFLRLGNWTWEVYYVAKGGDVFTLSG